MFQFQRSDLIAFITVSDRTYEAANGADRCIAMPEFGNFLSDIKIPGLYNDIETHDQPPVTGGKKAISASACN